MSYPLLTDAIENLTDVQRQAVMWDQGPMFVLAGPGSGKTRVLTTRIARILSESDSASFKVLALTFTNIAAQEMLSRVLEFVPLLEDRLVIGTFHSFCMQLLQQHGVHLGISPNFAIFTLEADRVDLMKEAMRSERVDGDVSVYLRLIDSLKSKLVVAEDSPTNFKDRGFGEVLKRVYQRYDELLREANAMDFNTMISQAFALVKRFPGVVSRVQKTYRYWLIDEFQDTTVGQYNLVRALAGDRFKNVFAVADDDQIIYQWNGASYAQIERFRKDFVPFELQLPRNYRCPPVIVDLANKLVSKNRMRSENKQPLEAGKFLMLYPASEHVKYTQYPDEQSEADGITEEIKKLGQNGWTSTVVLARTRTILARIVRTLNSSGVNAVIVQRRDDFISPLFQWLSAVLKLCTRPVDRMAQESMIKAFNHYASLAVSVEQVSTQVEVSQRPFLEEWASIATDLADAQFTKLIESAVRCSQERSTFRAFAKEVIDTADELDTDIAEDRDAWEDISRNIFRQIGSETSLEQFLQELSLRSKEPPIKPDTVSLMTIHSAKGKEFDQVFLAGLAEEVLPSFQSIKLGQDSAQMEEERRNCFVAITRVKERLHLSTPLRVNGFPKRPSRFLYEMELLKS